MEAKIAKSPDRPGTAGVPFCGLTAYQSEFVNWGPCTQPGYTVRSKIYTMPFKGQSTYSSTFVPPDLKSKAEPMRKLYKQGKKMA